MFAQKVPREEDYTRVRSCFFSVDRCIALSRVATCSPNALRNPNPIPRFAIFPVFVRLRVNLLQGPAESGAAAEITDTLCSSPWVSTFKRDLWARF